MKIFDLMFCHLGSGCTVCDRNQEEYGDYKIVALIADWGGLHIRDGHIRHNPDALARVNNMALRMMDKARTEFFKLPDELQLRRWYGSMTLYQRCHQWHDWPEEKSSEWLYSQWFANNCRNHCYEAPQEQRPENI